MCTVSYTISVWRGTFDYWYQYTPINTIKHTAISLETCMRNTWINYTCIEPAWVSTTIPNCTIKCVSVCILKTACGGQFKTIYMFYLFQWSNNSNQLALHYKVGLEFELRTHTKLATAYILYKLFDVLLSQVCLYVSATYNSSSSTGERGLPLNQVLCTVWTFKQSTLELWNVNDIYIIAPLFTKTNTVWKK